jgi:ribosomal protein S18 acetylase RimI-like enzyme
LKCRYCMRDAVYKCIVCGQLLCGEHAQLGTVCRNHKKKAKLTYTFKRKSSEDRKSISKYVRIFWGEEEQVTFEREFKVSELPGYVAKSKDKIVGFISTGGIGDDTIIVALGILPEYQGVGIGRRLIRRVEREAKRTKKKMLLVSTSNDDLPALGFYQKLGFQICEVKPNAIAIKHGKILRGIGNLPVRDELRLKKNLAD